MLIKINTKKIIHAMVVISFVLLASCSTSFAYNNLPWLSSFWVDDYIDLNSSQAKQLKIIIKQTRNWHRQVELPKYKQDLIKLQKTFNSEFNISDLTQQVTVAKLHWSNLLIQVKAPLIELAKTLSTKQQQELVTNIQANLADELKQYQEQTTQQLSEERLKEQLSYYKDWLGKLTKQQTQLITVANEQYINTFVLWQCYKQNRLNALQQAFSYELRNVEQFEQQMSIIITDREYFISEELAAKNQANLMAHVNLLVSLNSTLSDKQRRHVNKHFAELIETVDDLIAD
ncbi:DUF6279 family lipoprotein [Pseudoalteromonas translucida]|uniref:Membrane protein n=1 Tax=Pseudoalteromonas translucida (strain TAC 125) TaxID=326442 RepID=Q3IC24_PSET1|nr:DUF6279 family lipoprotein [Pseudoalteromonas translucida]CAI89406.1 putative membrane protein [Pseudoalteromonas translucida]